MAMGSTLTFTTRAREGTPNDPFPLPPSLVPGGLGLSMNAPYSTDLWMTEMDVIFIRL